MTHYPAALPLEFFTLERGSPTPLYQQLYAEARQAILTGRLAPGTRLPPTRVLADQLGVSRSTIINAYELLLSEGYLDGLTGSGTFVATTIPESLLLSRSTAPSAPTPPTDVPQLSRRGLFMATSYDQVHAYGNVHPFNLHTPALDAFPLPAWSKLAARCHRSLSRAHLAHSDPLGYRPLREAIAAYLAASRSVNCGPDQVFVVSGSQLALDFVARVLLDPGDTVWIEDPGHPMVWKTFLAAGAQVVAVPVDGDGLDVSAGVAAAPRARLAFVTPSHQYPLGATMSLARRLALLDWANREAAWIVEDDLDGEFRYSGRPLPALQGLDRHSRTFYLGNFDKVLFPSLHLGYVVVPADLVEAIARARVLVDPFPPLFHQIVLAEFIAAGHFERHIRRMRTLYAARRDILLDALANEFGDGPRTGPAESGTSVTVWLGEDVDLATLAAEAARRDIELPLLSAFWRQPPPEAGNGLVLGFAGFDEWQIRDGVRRLARLAASARRARPGVG